MDCLGAQDHKLLSSWGLNRDRLIYLWRSDLTPVLLRHSGDHRLASYSALEILMPVSSLDIGAIHETSVILGSGNPHLRRPQKHLSP